MASLGIFSLSSLDLLVRDSAPPVVDYLQRQHSVHRRPDGERHHEHEVARLLQRRKHPGNGAEEQ